MQGLASVDTERLRLKRWDHAEHARALALMNADSVVVEYVGGVPLTFEQSAEMSARLEAHWDTYGHGLWAVIVKDSGTMVGCVGCEQLGLDELVSFVHPENTRSLAVTERLGMVEEAEVPHPSRDERIRIMRRACSTS